MWTPLVWGSHAIYHEDRQLVEERKGKENEGLNKNPEPVDLDNSDVTVVDNYKVHIDVTAHTSISNKFISYNNDFNS